MQYYKKLYTSCSLKYSEFNEKLMGYFNAEGSQNISNTKIILGVIDKHNLLGFKM